MKCGIIRKIAKQNKDYGYDIQKLYLEMMLANAETFVRCQSIFDFSLFDRKLQDTAQFVKKYVTEYNTLPTYEMVNKSCNVDLKQTEQLTEEHFDWLLNDFETFVRHKSLERAILKSADMLEKGEYGPVEDLVKKAVQIGLHKDLGTDYFDDPKQRLMGLKNQNGQVSTGWTTLDKRLFGGFNKGELNIFAGGSGAGKSLFLANMGCNWVLNGMNVAYITFELSEPLVSMRIDSMLTDIPTKEIFKDLDGVEMKVKLLGKKAGKFNTSGHWGNQYWYRKRCRQKGIQPLKKLKDCIIEVDEQIIPPPLLVMIVCDIYMSEYHAC